MKNLDLLSDDEIERLRREGRISNPIGSLTYEQMRRMLEALGVHDVETEDLETRTNNAEINTNDAGKLVLGAGYVQTREGPEVGVIGYRIKAEK